MRKMIGAALAAVMLAAVQAGAASGQTAFEEIAVHGASLEGNLIGDSPDRKVYVYLPPSYAAETDRRYPVVYLLHGFGIGADRWHTFLDTPAAMDRAFAAGAQEMIVVAPDAQNAFNGSFYSNSVTVGDWEGFIAGDLVAYIDAHYRTIADRDSRGIGGHSMGGYGSIRLSMKRPDVFGVLYAMSSCCLPPQSAPDGASPVEALTSLEQATGLPFGQQVPVALAAAWAPNPNRPPLYFDALTLNGEPQPEVVAAMGANAPVVMIHQYVPALKRMNAIGMEIGLQDGLLEGNERLHALLDSYGIAHSWETYEGDHGNRIPERFEMNLLPFFSQHLAFE